MSRIFVFEVHDDVDYKTCSLPAMTRHLQKLDKRIIPKCSMSFESWVKLNGYDKEIPLPAFLPKGVDPKALHKTLKNALTIPMEKRK